MCAKKALQSPLVGIIMGSKSDLEVMREACLTLDSFNVPYELNILSAHRTPDETSAYARGAEKRGLKVLIAGAGCAAHLAGVVTSHTILPVIGVPIDSSPLSGLDALLSTVQMPGGMPVATVSIGKAGARNAAILSVEILATGEKALKTKLRRYRSRLTKKVLESNKDIN
ncbi:MAG: 5-(carboxyamino)imidazole ribonucleotide mutase [Thermodesulfobacteriota bacterium]